MASPVLNNSITMKSIYQLFFILWMLLSGQVIFAQAQPVKIIVKFKPNVNIQKWQQTHFQTENSPIEFKELVSERFNLALLAFDASQISWAQTKDFLSKDILWMTKDESEIEFRDTPNDPLFSSQWALQDIHPETFWDRNKDGVSWGGDTVVVAVMESGTSLHHPDLVDNFWHNYNEIPNDGIDNDGNGYVDDFLGWNSVSNNDTHAYDAHGTRVSGVIGAKTDNALGVAGINWNIKMLPVSFNQHSYVSIFKAFDYIITQRQLYNESNGAKGAFIVAVNESFGANKVKPSDDPNFQQWCDYMDALGEVGILTVAATINSAAVNVDIEGDMPTTCPQDHLISVTDIDRDGIRHGGFGEKSIDLGAPGTGILTTNGTDGFTSFDGTSAATPHVTATVALIYGFPCEKWNQLVHSQPSKAALQAKQWILDNTWAKSSMQDRTVTGGTLNLEGIVEDMDFFCAGNKLEPLALKIKPNIIHSTLIYEYNLPSFGQFDLDLYNMLGQKLWHKQFTSDEHTLESGTIDVSHYPSGMYFLVIRQGKESASKKFVTIR